MNLSEIISSVIMQLGLYNITLPFKNDKTGDIIPVENVIRNVLVTTTIPRYSQFVPWIRTGNININQLKIIDRSNNIYMLPSILTTTDVLYVVDVHPANNFCGTYIDSTAPIYGGVNSLVEGFINATEYMMVSSQMRAEPTFDDLGYNKIRLYGYPRSAMITIKVACNHEPNGETIEEGCRDSFLELAILDIKEFLYNNLKYYEEIPSAFGSIKLRIEDYQSASSDRDQLLEKWRDTFHLDFIDYIEWM